MNNDSLCAAIIGSSHADPDCLAIVSDRRLSVAALAALLLREPHLTMLEAARGQAEVEEALRGNRPLVLVVDGSWVELPSAIDPAGWNGRTLLLLDPVDDSAIFLRAVRSGTQGYLSRSASLDALVAAIQSVRDTGYYLDPLLASRILQASEEARRQPVLVPEAQLSQRELDVLARVAVGRSSKEIAREYAVTAKTVCNHVSNIYAKLNLRHRGELVLYAAQHGLAEV